MQTSQISPELKVPSFELFPERSSYLSSTRLFFAFYKKLPSIKYILQIDISRFKLWFESQSEFRILSFLSKEGYRWSKKKMSDDDYLYMLDIEIIVHLSDDESLTIAFAITELDIAQNIINYAKRFHKKEEDNDHDIHLVVPAFGGGIETAKIKIAKPKLKLEHNYNDDLSVLHPILLKGLKQRRKAGLLLFYGEPGTGKSTYIRHLIHCIRKKVIFISPSMAANLDAPELTKFLIENSNSVFVIEEAEDLIVSREKEKNSSISMLLNLTDGLLGQSLGIQFIATFNTNINNIDKALLRKGRLLGLYEFKPLSLEKSKKLIMQTGQKDYTVHKAMTLAEIYNIEMNEFQYKPDKQTIGFLNKSY
jgi:hypothetical protein